jgi:hypothetical protein
MYNFCHPVNRDTKLKCVRAQFPYTQPVHSHRKWQKISKFTAGVYMLKDLLALLFSPFHLLVTVLLRYITFSPNRKGTVYMSIPRIQAMDLQQNATFSSSGKDIVYMDSPSTGICLNSLCVERTNLLPHFTRLCIHHVLVTN